MKVIGNLVKCFRCAVTSLVILILYATTQLIFPCFLSKSWNVPMGLLLFSKSMTTPRHSPFLASKFFESLIGFSCSRIQGSIVSFELSSWIEHLECNNKPKQFKIEVKSLRDEHRAFDIVMVGAHWVDWWRGKHFLAFYFSVYWNAFHYWKLQKKLHKNRNILALN